MQFFKDKRNEILMVTSFINLTYPVADGCDDSKTVLQRCVIKDVDRLQLHDVISSETSTRLLI